MTNPNNTIAIIPSSQFKWTFQVQLKESLETRDEAILYASQHGCNLIVQYSKRSGPQFDVLQDPELDCSSEANCEFVEEVPVVMEPKSRSRSKSMFRNLFGLARRLGAAASASRQEKAMPSAHSHALAAK